MPFRNSLTLSKIFKIELYCIWNGFLFSLRHRRYLTVMAIIYVCSILKWRKAMLARFGFVFLQIIDDIIDGDRKISEDEEQWVRQRLSAFLYKRQPTEMVDYLGVAFRQELDKRSNAREDAVAWGEKIILNMLEDLPRRKNRTIYSRAELRKHMHETFYLSLNLMLLGLNSPIRSKNLPHLIANFVWCSMYRDLDDDLELGIINIPSEVLTKSNLKPHKLVSKSQVLNNSTLRDWLEQVTIIAINRNSQVDAELKRQKGMTGYFFLKVFAKAFGKFQGKAVNELHLEVSDQGSVLAEVRK